MLSPEFENVGYYRNLLSGIFYKLNFGKQTKMIEKNIIIFLLFQVRY